MGQKSTVGRPALVPTPEERQIVEELSGLGIPQEQIASAVRGGIDKVTLYKYFRMELDEGKRKMNAKVAKRAWQRIEEGSDKILELWLRTQCRWSNTEKHEHSGPGGEPIEFKKIERIIIDVPSDDDE